MSTFAKLLLLGIISLSIVLAAPFIGMVHISVAAVFSPQAGGNQDSEIFWKIRVPRVVFAFIAGGGLTVCGLVFQGMFRNFLATPFTLGISSGAAVGAVVYIISGASASVFGLTGSALSSLVGALLTALFVYLLANASEGRSSIHLLLGGVAVSYFFSNLIIFFQYLSDFSGLFRITKWLMGNLSAADGRAITVVSIFVASGILLLYLEARNFNLTLVSDEFAQSRGLNLKRFEFVVFFGTSLIIAGVVSFCGPIGFIGIIEPFLCRALFGYDHRVLIPASFLVGGSFLTFCDTIGRTIIAPSEIPVGVITALIGGPFFIWVLVRFRGVLFHGTSQ